VLFNGIYLCGVIGDIDFSTGYESGNLFYRSFGLYVGIEAEYEVTDEYDGLAA
jgi:hypothetical protein